MDLLSEQEVVQYLESVRATIRRCTDVMPTHAAFIEKHCKAPAMHRPVTTTTTTSN